MARHNILHAKTSFHLFSYCAYEAFPANSASTYRGHVLVKTRYLILSNAASKISSVNSLGTKLLVLEVLAALESVLFESMLVGLARTSSHGHTTLSLPEGLAGVLLRLGGLYGSYSRVENVLCRDRKILYSMLMGVSAVKGSMSVKKMSEASVNICRRWAVVTVVSDTHFCLKLRTSRRKIVFSAVNSRDAAQSMRASTLWWMLNSRACMEALGFSSLLSTT
jgi:hypothetical protein